MLETDGELEAANCSMDFMAMMNSQLWVQGFAPPLFCSAFKFRSQRILQERQLNLQPGKNGPQFDVIWVNHADSVTDYKGVSKMPSLVEHAEAL